MSAGDEALKTQDRSHSPSDPSQRKFLNLESMESGIASMSAVDKA